MSLNNPKSSVQKVIGLVKDNANSHIRLNANGGNSILIICDPVRELEYIEVINALMTNDKYRIIDLNELFCEFVTANKSEIEDSFELLKGSIHQIFKTPDGEEGTDLFGLIIQTIADSLKDNKIPVLINTGTLYGSGIDNIHIMENELIMKASLPLIVLYPATKDNDKIMFLNSRPASKYRCMIV